MRYEWKSELGMELLNRTREKIYAGNACIEVKQKVHMGHGDNSGTV